MGSGGWHAPGWDPPPARPRPNPETLRNAARRLPLGLLLFLTLAACGGAGRDPAQLTTKGNQALGSGELATAQGYFDQAIEVIGGDTSHPEYMRAHMGAIEAHTKTDPDRAVADFLTLAKAKPDGIRDRDYQLIGGRLGDAQNFDQAIELAQAGKKAFPESTTLDALVRSLGDRAQASGNDEALKTLKGLGYVGDDR